MKLVKKIYTFITAAACCAAISGIMPFSSSAEESVKTYGDLSYVTSDSDGDRIYDYIAIIDCNESVTKIEIPAEIEDIPVVEIKSSAFNGCANLTSIIIPDSVTSIGDFAFENCSGLTSITIPDSVTSIGDHAFYNCSSLTNITVSENNKYFSSLNGVLFNKDKTELVTYLIGNERTEYAIPDSVTSIGDRAFYKCSSLTSIIIPDSVTSIGDHAFYNCSSLTNITIPDSVTSIGDHAFHNCSGLTSITIPDSVTSIGDHAFYNCLTSITVSENNKYFSSLNGVLFNKDKTELITYPIGNERTEYTIPDSVTSIGNFIFYNCSSLTSITIPDSVTSIGNFAFYNCSSLTSITIPDSVASIGNSAFYNCSNLTNIKLPDVIDIISGNTFRDCSSLLNIIIPDSVTSIKECAFYNCSNLTSITIPDSVASIENSAFYNCTSLKSITLNNPDCEISNDKDTIPETAVICGYENSTAQAYAERYYKRFVAIEDIGDISGNGKIDLYDAIEIAKAIMGMRTFTEEEKLIADFNKDVTVDLYDAIEIARTLLPK